MSFKYAGVNIHVGTQTKYLTKNIIQSFKYKHGVRHYL